MGVGSNTVVDPTPIPVPLRLLCKLFPLKGKEFLCRRYFFPAASGFNTLTGLPAA